MPCATQPAVTRASPILLGCRMLDGQVVCDEDPRDVGLLAGRVALERADSWSFSKDALVDCALPAKSKDNVMTALMSSLSLVCR